MIRRLLSSKIRRLSRQFPVVAIAGPRQSGKTTLARALFRRHGYVNLEDPIEREFAQEDPRGFLRRFERVILDEIQKSPNLLSFIQIEVDQRPAPGKFILTGSQQLPLMSHVAQTLAGRTAIVNLLTFSVEELYGYPSSSTVSMDRMPAQRRPPKRTRNELLYCGFYPPIHDRGLDPHDWLYAYYRTYVERDVRDVANIGDLDAFQRFIRLCAGRSGQLLNLTSLANDCGISHTTARHWISVLSAGFILHLLPPHFTNFSKRLTKSPKLYFLDTGLLCYLLGIRKPDEIDIHPLKGPIFETFAISEIYKAFAHRGENPPLYFWRDRTGHEVDLIVDVGRKLIPVEIKSSETPSASLFSGLRYFSSLGPPASKRGSLIYGGDSLYQREGMILRPWFSCA